MPTYEYQCDGCHKTVEIFQPMTADPVKVCPECGSNKIRRIISGGVGVIFKGSGFYCTDYKGKNASSASSASK